MSKKITIGTKPTAASSANLKDAAEEWVKSRATEPAEPMKRLTIDIPANLHRAIKAQCAMRGVKIAEEIREILMQKYGNQ